MRLLEKGEAKEAGCRSCCRCRSGAAAGAGAAGAAQELEWSSREKKRTAWLDIGRELQRRDSSAQWAVELGVELVGGHIIRIRGLVRLKFELLHLAKFRVRARVRVRDRVRVRSSF